MKYIRTKDGHILELGITNDYGFVVMPECKKAVHFIEEGKEFVDIIAQADTIEELCDEFVVYAEDYDYFKPTKTVHRHWVFDDIEEAKEKIKFIGAGIERIIYGAIWCEWGLKYVAKMNERGELRLL